MARQLVLDLPVRAAMGREDFFVSASNAVAIARVDAWPDWAFGKLLLTGPEGSGKTHLVHVWAARADARVLSATTLGEADIAALPDRPALAVEDVDRMAGARSLETRLFHLHNAVAGARGTILFSARVPPSRCGFVLPDLESRLSQAEQVPLEAPDDALLSALLLKLAHDRALKLSPAIVAHVLPRLERSAAALGGFVDRLDALALENKRAPRLSDAKAALADPATPVSRSGHTT